jgi:predicted sulfurtransferase
MTTDELEPYVVENYNLLLTDFHTLMFDTKEQAEEFIGKFDSIIRIAALSNLIG